MALYYFSLNQLALADAVTLFFLNPGQIQHQELMKLLNSSACIATLCTLCAPSPKNLCLYLHSDHGAGGVAGAQGMELWSSW